MKSMQEIADKSNLITEDQKVYDEMIQTLIESKENNVPINEGVLKAILGGVAGATVGPSIMKAVCKVLGISETGALGNLMTSRLILTSLAGYLGYKN